MIQMAIVLTTIGLFLASAPLFANQCSEVFQLNQKVRYGSAQLKTFDLNYVHNSAFTNGNDRPTMYFTGTVYKGSHGGKLRELTTTDGRWVSTHRPTSAAIVGSPIWNIIFLGPKLSYILGFRFIDVSRITLPDAQELNGGLLKLNLKLKHAGQKPLPFKFFELNKNAQFEDMEFIQKFLNGEIPLDGASLVGIHDLSYHAAQFLLPPEMIKQMQESVRFTLKTIDYLEKNKKPGGLFDKKDALHALATRIDGLGNLSHYLAHGPYSRNNVDKIEITEDFKMFSYATELHNSQIGFMKSVLHTYRFDVQDYLQKFNLDQVASLNLPLQAPGNPRGATEYGQYILKYVQERILELQNLVETPTRAPELQ